jgi:hypothetical protein
LSKRRTTVEDLAQDLLRTLDRADQCRRAHFEEALRQQEAKETALRFERARLAARHGTEHPRVKRASERLQAHADLRHVLREEIERSGVPQPEADAEHCTFHGRVTDGNGGGVPGLTVAAVGTKEKALAKAGTKEAGYYSLRVATARPEAVRLVVYARGQKVLHRDKQPWQASPGTVLYNEITIDPEKA